MAEESREYERGGRREGRSSLSSSPFLSAWMFLGEGGREREVYSGHGRKERRCGG